MPDRIEVAASGRARCRACRRSIAKGEERFAEAVPNPVAAGESQQYYHLPCAAERRPKPFAAFLASSDPPRTDLEGLAASAALGVEHARLERLGLLERSKSARANCRQCHEPIEKGAWRVALQPIEEGRVAAWGFVHLACAGAYTGIKPSFERLTRYTELLSPEEAAVIASGLESMPTPDPIIEDTEAAEAAEAAGPSESTSATEA